MSLIVVMAHLKRPGARDKCVAPEDKALDLLSVLIIWAPMKELAWEIAETAHALRRFYDRRALQLGVTRAQWRVLAWLSREPGLKQVELADRLDVEPISACRIVDRLAEAGLVERQRDPTDRRVWRLMLTEKAKPLLDRLTELAEEMTGEAFAGLDLARVEAMRTALTQIRENISIQDGLRRAIA